MHNRKVIAGIAAVLPLLAASLPVVAQESPAHKFCRMTEGDGGADYEACVARQIAGARSVAQRLSQVRADATTGAALIEAYDRCRGLWSPDFALIETCLTQRLEGVAIE